MSEVGARLAEVRGRIEAAALRSGRSADAVRLVAVSKGQPAERVVDAIDAGTRDLGENRVQELRQKRMVVPGPVRWHFVGHLQTNKVRHVVGSVDLVHSVDRFGLAEAIGLRARSLGVVQEVLVEVNVAREPNKHGVPPEQALGLALEVAGIEGVEVKGLMTMAPLSDDPEKSRSVFAQLRDLGSLLEARLPGAGELSMGMTGDFEVGVEEGATIVRVGTAIFGSRSR